MRLINMKLEDSYGVVRHGRRKDGSRKPFYIVNENLKRIVVRRLDSDDVTFYEGERQRDRISFKLPNGPYKGMWCFVDDEELCKQLFEKNASIEFRTEGEFKGKDINP